MGGTRFTGWPGLVVAVILALALGSVPRAADAQDIDAVAVATEGGVAAVSAVVVSPHALGTIPAPQVDTDFGQPNAQNIDAATNEPTASATASCADTRCAHRQTRHAQRGYDVLKTLQDAQGGSGAP